MNIKFVLCYLILHLCPSYCLLMFTVGGLGRHRTNITMTTISQIRNIFDAIKHREFVKKY